jgi:hypothetical protein
MGFYCGSAIIPVSKYEVSSCLGHNPSKQVIGKFVLG